MPRSIWTGAVSFGLVNVPVRLHTAVREHTLRFHQLDSHGDRVRYKRVSERTGEEVDYGEIVKGYEVTKGRYVPLSREEIDRHIPKATHTIDVDRFVDLAAIDPIYFDRTYYLAPEDRVGAARAYRVLAEAMEKTQKVAIGTFVMHDREHLVAIRVGEGGVLVASTLQFADEIVDPKTVEPEGGEEPVAREVTMAQQLVDAMSDEWTPEQYHDTFAEQLRELIEHKVAGEELVEVEAEEPAPVVDLVAALEESLQRNGPKKERRGGKSRSRSRKAS